MSSPLAQNDSVPFVIRNKNQTTELQEISNSRKFILNFIGGTKYNFDLIILLLRQMVAFCVFIFCLSGIRADYP